MPKAAKIVSWVFSIAVAVLYLQTVLLFKFPGATESIYIFEKVAGPEMEGFARIGSGIAELITAVLLLIPKTRIYGAILSVFVILGAIFSHLTILGIEVQNDGGTLFFLAMTIFVLSLIVIFLHRSDIPFAQKPS